MYQQLQACPAMLAVVLVAMLLFLERGVRPSQVIPPLHDSCVKDFFMFKIYPRPCQMGIMLIWTEKSKFLE